MSHLRLRGFGVTRFGKPITEISVHKPLYTGIDFQKIPGCIPVFVEVAACNASNYRYFGDWQELTGKEKGWLIAHYMLSVMVENHTKDAEAQAIARASR